MNSAYYPLVALLISCKTFINSIFKVEAISSIISNILLLNKSLAIDILYFF